MQSLKTYSELTLGGDKDLRVVFFYCDWFDPTRGTRENKYGMVQIKHKEWVHHYASTSSG
jgi:hypothetical protein